MNETLNTIYQRRSVRKYKDLPVKREIIEQLISAGRMAPSGMNKQHWKFHILTDKDHIKTFSKAILKIWKATLNQMDILKPAIDAIRNLKLGGVADFLSEDDPIFHSAPVVIYITAPKHDDYAALNVGMCAQNIMLAAKSMGLESCCAGYGKLIEHTDMFNILDIPVDEEIYLALVIGYGNEQPPSQKRVEDNIFYV